MTILIGTGPFKRFRGNDTDTFSSSFKSMLAAYVSLTAEQKAEQARRVVRALGTQEHRALEVPSPIEQSLPSMVLTPKELVDILSISGVQVNSPMPQTGYSMPVPHVHNASCPPDCNLSENMVSINEFMDDVFFGPS